MLHMLQILETLRHNEYHARASTWMNLKRLIEQLPNFFYSYVSKCSTLLYIVEALRHNDIIPELLPGWTRKDIEQLPIFFFNGGKYYMCYIYPRRAQA